MHSLRLLPVMLIAAAAIGCSQTVQSPDSTASEQPDSAVVESEVVTTDSAPTEPTDTATNEPVSSASLPAVYAQSGVAIAGADPVAYFTEGAYVPGSDQFAYNWSGTTWHFSSAENRDVFANDPTAYAPQYGGFCAWAVSQGYSAPVDPEAWKIVDNKLYLNYDKGVQARWERDIPGNIAKADTNWPEVAAGE